MQFISDFDIVARDMLYDLYLTSSLLSSMFRLLSIKYVVWVLRPIVEHTFTILFPKKATKKSLSKYLYAKTDHVAFLEFTFLYCGLNVAKWVFVDWYFCIDWCANFSWHYLYDKLITTVTHISCEFQFMDERSNEILVNWAYSNSIDFLNASLHVFPWARFRGRWRTHRTTATRIFFNNNMFPIN